MLSCLLQEQRLVFFSADWAKLTLVAESLLLYLQVSAGGTLCFLIFLLNLKIIPNFLQHSLIHLSICCLLHLFQPLSWQQPYVPVLSGGMLDFLMAPTAFLMGCHISHFEEVAAVSTNIHCLCSCSIKDKSLCLLAVSKSDLFFDQDEGSHVGYFRLTVISKLLFLHTQGRTYYHYYGILCCYLNRNGCFTHKI